MYATYELSLYSGIGVPTVVVADFVSLTYARSVNAPGTAVLTLPYTETYWNALVPETILQVYRRGESRVVWLAGGTHWLMTKREMILDQSGSWRIIATFADLIDVLKRWLVAYPAGDAHSTKSGAAETVIKAIVTEELITRGGLGGYITVEGDAGRGQNVSVTCSWQDVNSALSNVAQSSAQLGTYVAYDFEVLGIMSYLFRVYTGQRGTDRSPTSAVPLWIDVDAGSIAMADYVMDYSSSATAVTVGGQKTSGAQVTATATNAALEGNGPFAHREMYGSAQNTTSAAVLTSQANDLLREYRPAGNFTAQAIVLGNGIELGVNVDFGDLVSVSFGPINFLAALETLSVTVDGASGLETVSTTMRYVGAL